MMAGGYVKVFRKIEEWRWYSDANTFRVFLHCLLRANYEEKKWKRITVEAGSFITSSMKLAEELKLSRQQIRTALSNLQDTQEITIKSTNKYMVIYVQNWRKYQGNDVEDNQQDNQQITSNATIKQPTNNHNEEYKEYKEEKNIKEKSISYDIQEKKVSTSRFVKPTIQEIDAYCKSRKNGIDASAFYDHYESNGWMVGKTHMKDWQATVRTWERNRKPNQQNYQQPKRIIKSSNVQESDSDDPKDYGAAVLL